MQNPDKVTKASRKYILHSYKKQVTLEEKLFNIILIHIEGMITIFRKYFIK